MSSDPVPYCGPFVVPRTVHRLRIGGRAALFSEREQQIYRLNDSADLIWSRLANGAGAREAEQELKNAGAAPDEAAAFVRDSAETWIAAGHLTPRGVAEQLLGSASATRYFRIHELCARVRFFGDASPYDSDRVFGQFAAAEGESSLDLAVAAWGGRFFVFADGQPLGVSEQDGVVPQLKAALTERCTRFVKDAFLAHAALLARGDRSLLLSGAPGAGKTTLCLALMNAGFGFLADDIVRFDRDGQAVGIPFAPAVKSGAWPLVKSFMPEIETLPVCRRGDGQIVRYAPVQAAPNHPYTVDSVFLLAREAGAAARLEPLDPLDGFTAILGSAFSPDGAIAASHLKAFARTIGEAECFRIVYSDLSEAVAAISGAVS